MPKDIIKRITYIILSSIGILLVLIVVYYSSLIFFVSLSILGVNPEKYYQKNHVALNEFVAKIEHGNPSDFEDEHGYLKLPPNIAKKIKMAFARVENGVLLIEFKTSGWAGGEHSTLIYKSNGKNPTQEQLRYEKATYLRLNAKWFAVEWND